MITIEQSGQLINEWAASKDRSAVFVNDLLGKARQRRLTQVELAELVGACFAAGIVCAQRAIIDAEAAEVLADFPTGTH